MKKLQLLVFALAIGTITAHAQKVDEAPNGSTYVSNQAQSALFDVLINFDAGAAIGAQGNAGVIFFNNQYWVSAWASDLIHVLDNTGAFIETFSIPGVTGTRSMTTDGTSIFIGTATTVIYDIDPPSRTINNTINIIAPSGAEARMCTYDPTLDGGAGGFWIGDFGSDIASVDMDGAQLSVIPAAVHGQAVYGGAVDNVSTGGPFLWTHSQDGATGDVDRDVIVQLALPSGVPTGVTYRYLNDAIPGTTEVLSGGLFISDDVVPGGVTMIGLSQSTPSNAIFGLELIPSLGVNDNAISSFSLYPNPANGKVNINTTVAGDKQVVVYDILGKQVINTTIAGGELNISSLKAGVYMVSVTQNKATATKKLVVQ
ncbi:hypothetical protein AEQU2_02964 [Aequorivita lipolytica]|nr:hypothetical protein AEQU2_02964 [Aequorivita lipolytica]